MHKKFVMVPSTLIHTLTPVTKKGYNDKNIKVVQRVKLIRLKR